MTAWRDVAVHGVGTSLFGKQPELSAGDLVRRAVYEALDDAGRPAIDAVFAGTVFGAPGTVQRALQTCGVTEVPILTIENACASGTSAFHEACRAVDAGAFDHVLAVGVETMTLHFGGAIDHFIETVYNVPTLSETYKYAAYDGLQRLAARS